MPFRFEKVEGLGNDFLLLDRLDRAPAALQEELEQLAVDAPRLCDRRTGVGADGLLVVAPPRQPGSDAAMIVINHDGSRPEMCGNGLRCVAHWLCARNQRDRADVDTDAGLKYCEQLSVSSDPQREAEIRVDMGPPVIGEESSPAAGEGRHFLSVSMGNPHAIHFVASAEDPQALAHRLGPSLEVDPLYPQRSNIEFARVEDDSIELWYGNADAGSPLPVAPERVQLRWRPVQKGLRRADEDILVRLPGGTLKITVPSAPSTGITMQGPSRRVFRGEWMA